MLDKDYHSVQRNRWTMTRVIVIGAVDEVGRPMQRMMATTWLWSWVESPRIVGPEMEMMVPHAAQKRREIQLQLSSVPWHEIYESRCGGWCQWRAINFDREFPLLSFETWEFFKTWDFSKKGGNFQKGEFSKRGEVSFYTTIKGEYAVTPQIDWTSRK